jgi:hypothetical protein
MAAGLVACAPDRPLAPSPPKLEATMNNTLQSAVDAALADAAQRTGIATAALKVVAASAVTWSDGSIGCPQPGMMYTQALVPGYRIRIQAGKQELDYHSSLRGRPFPCPAERAVDPLPDQAI